LLALGRELTPAEEQKFSTEYFLLCKSNAQYWEMKSKLFQHFGIRLCDPKDIVTLKSFGVLCERTLVPSPKFVQGIK
jgi:hypothetical protein